MEANRQKDVNEKLKMLINPPVFFGSVVVIVAFVLFGAIYPDLADQVFSKAQNWIVATFGWFYMLAVAVFVIFTIGLALSGHGRVKLGPEDSEPDYSSSSWFAMLFSAGMGIGLIFFGVAEPILHFNDPPVGVGGDIAAARESLKLTMFHWGIHAWAIYAIIALSLAYYSFRFNLPLTIRSTLYPLIGERINGPIGHGADLFAVLGTMFGVATSLGFGALQVNAGINYLFEIPINGPVQLTIIAVITVIATASVVAGLDAGIKRLSQLNLILALALLLYVFICGPSLFLLEAFVQNTGYYLSEVVNKTFTMYAYEPNSWLGGWTLFYWAWWIAWSPFVGMFIARISRGRTIREFIVGVLFVPCGFTFLWLTIFGNTAISLDMGEAAGAISATVSENVPLALFRFFEYLPATGIISLLATVLVVTFFVTSSDSGSLVVDSLTNGGRGEGPVWQRSFWAVSEGAIAAVLLLTGGLQALQTASIITALPFTFIMLFVCYGMLQSLRLESFRRASQELTTPLTIRGTDLPWQTRLRTVLTYPSKTAAIIFLKDRVLPALEEVATELRASKLEVSVEAKEENVSLMVSHEGAREFLYAVQLREFDLPSFTLFKEGRKPEQKGSYYRAEVFLLEGSQDYDIIGYTRAQIIADVVSQYEKHIHYLHLIR